MYQPACDLPARGYFVRPTLFTNVVPVEPHRARGDLRAGALGASRSGRPRRPSRRRTTRPTACRPASGPRRAAASWPWSAGCARASSGPTPSTASTRPAPSGATRSRASGARAASTGCSPYLDLDAMSRPRTLGRRIDGPQDLQAVHRRPVPALRVGPLVRRPRRRRDAARERGPRLAQGPARRGPRRARRVPRLGGQDRHEPRPGAVPRGRAAGGPAGAVRGRGRGGRGPRRRRPPASRSTARSTAGLVRRLGGQDLPRCWAPSTRSGASYFDFSIPEPTGVVGIVAPESSSLLGLVSRLAPVVVSGNTARRAGLGGAAAARRDARPRCWPRAMCRVASSTSSRASARSSCPGWRRTWTSTRIDAWGVPARPARAAWRPPRSRTSSASRVRRGAAPTRFDWLDDAARPAPRVDRRVPRDEDGLASHRDVGVSWRSSVPLSPRSVARPSGRKRSTESAATTRCSILRAPPSTSATAGATGRRPRFASEGSIRRPERRPRSGRADRRCDASSRSTAVTCSSRRISGS